MERRDLTQPEVEEMLRSIAGESWALVDADGMVVYGVGPEGGGARPGTHIADLVHADDLACVLEVLTAPDETVTVRVRVQHGDGSWRPVDLTAVNRLDDARVGAVVIRTVEVSEAAPTSDDLVSSLAEAIPTPILVADRTGDVSFSNSAARSLLGDDFAVVAGHLAAARADGKPRLTFELGGRWIHARIAERSEGWVAMLDDVTSEKASGGDDLYKRATTDQLTGASNRASFDTKLVDVLAAADGRPVTVVFVDLDGFKAVNERHGHAAGDEVLRVVAARLKAEVRPDDTVARIGGDEFGIICPGLTVDYSPVLSERLVRAVRERIRVGGASIVVGAVVGTATAPPAPTDAAGLLATLDQTMYRDRTIEIWEPMIEL